MSDHDDDEERVSFGRPVGLPSTHAYNPQFSRRRFLATLGVSAAAAPFVPLLNASGQEATAPKRLILFFTPHGTVWDAWKPTGTETNFQLGTILAPLEKHRQKIAVLSGITMADQGVGAPHTKGAPLLWTGSTLIEDQTFERADGSGGRYFGWNSGPSIDQLVASAIGAKTPYKSLEFGVRSGGSHPASRTIYAGPKQPLSPEPNPYAMFDRLFGTSSAEQFNERQSSIDLIKKELDALKPRAGKEDRLKLDAHLQSIRAIETRLGFKAKVCAGPMLGAKIDHNAEANMPVVLTKQIELLAAAVACDMTRVASVQYTIGDNDNATYSWLGITYEGHHLITHAADNDAKARDALIKIYTWYADRFAYLLDQLDAVPEAGGKTMLDNSLVVWGTELAKGNTHSFSQTPFVVAGGGAGAMKMGRFLDRPGVRHNRLLVSIGRAMGLADLNTFGNTDNGTGPLAGL